MTASRHRVPTLSRSGRLATALGAGALALSAALGAGFAEAKPQQRHWQDAAPSGANYFICDYYQRGAQFAKGCRAGYDKGYRTGLNDGYDDAYGRAMEEGLRSYAKSKYWEGFQAGLKLGYEDGYEVGVWRGDRDGRQDAQAKVDDILGDARDRNRCRWFGECGRQRRPH